MPNIADQKKDFPQWYLDVIAQADLAEHADVRGCIVFRPYGYALWEGIQQELNRRIKTQLTDTIDGKMRPVDNVYFPLLIPESMLQKEKDHIEGFAPECAVVTHGGGKELTEKLYIRPTSETIIYSSFARWVQSHRDLPLKINQWANVVRWEMRPRAFLRTLEFLWQEGHTCHASEGEADEMTEKAIHMYAEFDRDFLAIPVRIGRKPDHEKFAGARYTLTTEALARDGKAIQAGTSHNLGQGFSEAYGVSFLDAAGSQQRPWMTSWGLSTRIIGTVIVVHGDEKGLRLPPRLAPIHAVIVPIYRTDEERRATVEKAHALKRELMAEAVDPFGVLRIHVDDREDKKPGFKYNEWEVKGVPLRIEIGPKDLEKNHAMVARRDTGEKSAIPFSGGFAKEIRSLLADIQSTLLAQAEERMQQHTLELPASFDAFKAYLEGEGGFVLAPWDGTLETAEKIKAETKATIRLLDARKPEKGMKDLVSGKPATSLALFAKAY